MSTLQALPRVDLPGVVLTGEPEALQGFSSYMDAGNKIRELTKCPDFVTATAIAGMGVRRSRDSHGIGEPVRKTVHVLNSLKRPEEVAMLRKIYGLGFYLIGIFASEAERREYLTNDKNIPKSDALKLMKRDEDEAVLFGQRTRDTFQLADVFVKLADDACPKQLERFLDRRVWIALTTHLSPTSMRCFSLTALGCAQVNCRGKWGPV